MRRICRYFKGAQRWMGKDVEWITCKKCQRRLYHLKKSCGFCSPYPSNPLGRRCPMCGRKHQPRF